MNVIKIILYTTTTTSNDSFFRNYTETVQKIVLLHEFWVVFFCRLVFMIHDLSQHISLVFKKEKKMNVQFVTYQLKFYKLQLLQIVYSDLSYSLNTICSLISLFLNEIWMIKRHELDLELHSSTCTWIRK